MKEDTEKGRAEPRRGFPAIASFVARDPDHETYIFRKFNYLTARNLVHLQSELLYLQSQLEQFDRKAETGDQPELTLSLRHWEILKANAAQRDQDERKLLNLAKEIEEKLDKYQKALLQAASITRLKEPSARAVKAYRHELGKMNIRGQSACMLDDEADLVALKPPLDGDLLSNTVREHWPFPLQHSNSQQAGHFQERTLQLIVSTVSVAIAAILLVGSIVTLYFVHDPDARLGLLILFIVLFAVGIRLSTSASRDSIFAATAAYAAVLVVFVSGDLGNAQPGG